MNKHIDWKKPEYFSVIVAFLTGLAVHMFGLVNVLHNHDDISMQPSGYGTGISSGRWVLTVLGDFLKKNFGNYNLHWLNGVIFLAFIAVTVGIFVAIFEIKSRKAAAVVAMLFVSFPTATSTILFRFTAGYYGFAIFLAVLAAWCAVKSKYLHGLPFAALCLAVSLGIYQSQIPLTISIFVLVLLQQSLKDDADVRQIVRRGIYYCVTLVCGLLLYYLFLKICLHYYNTALSSYQNIDSMGQLSAKELLDLVVKAYKSFFLLPTEGYASLASIQAIKFCYQLIGICSVILLGFNLVVRRKNIILTAASCVLYLLLPLAINFIVVMCPSSWIYTLMVYSFVLIPCTPLVLFDTLPQLEDIGAIAKNVLRYITAAGLALLIFCNAYMTNVNYSALYYANRQTENTVTSLVTQIRATEGFDTGKKLAFIGKINDPLLVSSWQYVPMFGGNMNSKTLLSAYSWDCWISHYLGYSFNRASTEEITAVKTTPEYQQMPCWPNEGSIRVIDSLVVVKFAE